MKPTADPRDGDHEEGSPAPTSIKDVGVPRLEDAGRHHSWHLPSLMGRTATAAPRSFRQLPVQIGSQRLANPTLPLMAYPIRGSNCRPKLALQCLDLTNSMACARCRSACAFPRCRHGHPGDLPRKISSHSRCGTQLCTYVHRSQTFTPAVPLINRIFNCQSRPRGALVERPRQSALLLGYAEQ